MISHIQKLSDTEKTIKIYPYIMTAFHNDKFEPEFSFGANTHSFIAISQEQLRESKEFLYDGKDIYFEIIMDAELSQGLKHVSNTESAGVILEKMVSFEAITNNFDSKFKEYEIICFLEPFNNQKNISGFTASNINVIDGSDEFVKYNYEYINDKNSFTKIQFDSMKARLSSFINCTFSYYINDKGYITHPVIDMVDPKGKHYEAPGFEVSIPTNSLISRIQALGYSEEIDGNLDLMVKGNFVPFQASPRDLSNKLTLSGDWFEFSTVLPYEEIIRFINNKNLLDGMNPQGTTPTPTQKDMYKLLGDMMCMTILYKTNFSGVKRLKPDAKVAGQVGQIDPEAVCCSTKQNILALEKTTVIGACDNLYKNFKSKHPNISDEDDKMLSRFICALSPYISSSRTVAGGSNEIYKAVLPWYFQAIASVENSFSDDKKTVIWKEIEFNIGSQWFDTTTGLKPLKEYDISDLITIQAEKKIILPKLPNLLSPIDKVGLPGAMFSKNENGMKYMWFLPFTDNDAFRRFYLDTTIPAPHDFKKKFDMPFTDYGHFYNTSDLAKTEVDYCRKHFATPTSIVISKDTGIRVTKSAPQVDINIDERGTFAVIDTQRNITDEEVMQVLIKKQKIKSGLDINACEFHFPTKFYFTGHMTHDPSVKWNGYVIKGHYQLQADTYNNCVCEITGQVSPIDNTERPLLYDKTDWKFLLKQLQIFDEGEHLFKLFEKNLQPIDYLKEVTFNMIWADSMRLKIGTYDFKVNVVNRIDEQVAFQRVLWT